MFPFHFSIGKIQCAPVETRQNPCPIGCTYKSSYQCCKVYYLLMLPASSKKTSLAIERHPTPLSSNMSCVLLLKLVILFKKIKHIRSFQLFVTAEGSKIWTKLKLQVLLQHCLHFNVDYFSSCFYNQRH